ncbi:hypothetical protein OVA24_16575 [Luteolibacter sp. SL250]|uniref:hypothetical protein n=1 Tax=Luteolibacter sp. SL250 TaxID=2995170 RepID=UPI002270B41C|nr:hypothetical protein [Luteolibacter sp. SL250]WAC18847.1 hypothetical protein OVA24_16575 [Luteolibacter sp. SL250]
MSIESNKETLLQCCCCRHIFGKSEMEWMRQRDGGRAGVCPWCLRGRTHWLINPDGTKVGMRGTHQPIANFNEAEFSPRIREATKARIRKAVARLSSTDH